MVNLESLKTACFFAKLDSSSLKEISQFIFENQHPSGELVLLEGENSNALYFVISGLLKLFATSVDGREFVIRLAYGGDSVNDDAVLNNSPNSLSASAMSPVVLYGLRLEHLKKIMQTYPQVRESINEVLASRQRYLVRLAADLVFQTVTGRLARLLLEQEKLALGGARLRITQQEMASMIGTVREMVSRSLRELEGQGAVRIEKNRILIANRKRLGELSGEL